MKVKPKKIKVSDMREDGTYVMKDIKISDQHNCLTCSHCLPIGEGDHYCDERQEIVIVDYEPSDKFFCCGGRAYDKA